MFSGFRNKFRESLQSVLPVTAIVLILSVTLTPMPLDTLVMFLAGALLLIDSKTITDVIGIALLVVVIAYQKLVYQRKHKSGEPPAPVSTAV